MLIFEFFLLKNNEKSYFDLGLSCIVFKAFAKFLPFGLKWIFRRWLSFLDFLEVRDY